MRGHAPLIDLRRRGLRPAAVWIDATGIDSLQSWRDWHTNQPLQPHIDVAPAETVQRLDLRCLRGVSTVFLDALVSDVQRQLDLIEAIQSEGVQRIVAGLSRARGQGQGMASLLSGRGGGGSVI